MIRTLILVLVATFAFAVDEKPEPKSPATILYEKALADNSKEVEKTYAVYLKALEVANAKVLKALEVAKSDLNDPKKGKLSITDRAKALEELEGKIKSLKGGELATVVAEKEKEKAKDAGDLLGDEEKLDVKKAIQGKWKFIDGVATYAATVDKGMKLTLIDSTLAGTIVANKDESITINWNNGIVYNLSYNKETKGFSGLYCNKTPLSFTK
jgi:hypothetical protein